MLTKNNVNVNHRAVSKNLSISAVILGNILELYDYMLYSFFSVVISVVFFPNKTKFISVLLSFLVFALAYLVRPIGGLIFGYLSDTYSRKKVLFLTMSIMGLASLSIAIMPTYNQIGMTAIFLLITARIFQGISISGEFVNTVAFLYENSPEDRRNFVTSLSFSGGVTGMLLASGICTYLTFILSDEQLYQWGWRLPFFIGAIIAVLGFYLRKTYLHQESKVRNSQHPYKQLFSSYKLSLAKILIVSCTTNLCFFIAFVYSPTFYKNSLGIDLKHSMTIVTTSLVVYLFSLLVSGYICDKTNRLYVITISSIILICSSLFYMNHINPQNTLLLQLLLSFNLAFVIAPIPGFMASQVPQTCRASAISLGYNGGIAFSAIIIPVLIAFHIKSNFPLAGCIAFLASVLVLVCSYLIVQEKKGIKNDYL